MLDGLRFWGIYPEAALRYPYNIVFGLFLAWILYLIARQAVFVLKRNELERNLIKFPGLAEVRVQLGDLYFDNKNFRQAKILYIQAIDMHPGLHYARIKLAEIYFMSKHEEKAVEQLSELLKRTSDEKYKFSVKSILSRWNVPSDKISKMLNS